MTTYSHTLTLGEIEYPIVREALLLLLGKCRSEDDEAEQARAIVYEAIINDMLASLEESRDLSSTSSFCQDAPSTRIDPKPNNGATFSECGRYRYKLCRIWDDSLPQVTFIGLNPSTADASIDDQTVKRCTGFTKDWGYGGFQIVNLFAYRSTDPSVLKDVEDPVGPDNDHYIKEATGLDAALVITAWGEDGGRFNRSIEVLQLVERGMVCLGYTKDGYPRHPSRAPKNSMLVPYPESD